MLQKRNLRMVAILAQRARLPTATLQERLGAAQLLVAFGAPHLADGAIAAAAEGLLAAHGPGRIEAQRTLDRLSAISGRFRQAGIESKLASIAPFAGRLLDTGQNAILSIAPNASTLLVVFASMFNDFWVSFPVLHCLLPTETTSVLYLKDPHDLMYLKGVEPYGETFEDLCAGVGAQAAQLGISDIRVTGFSSGGYPALLFASKVGASAYLGFSIRTDLAEGSPLPTDRYVERPELREARGDLMFDLKPPLAATAVPTRMVLYCGAEAAIDKHHARHLDGLPNVVVQELPATRHNTIVTLLAEGKFETVLREFLS